MKVLSYDDFLKEPSGVIFSFSDDYGRGGYEGLYCKGETVNDSFGIAIDYFYTNLTPEEGNNEELGIGVSCRYLSDGLVEQWEKDRYRMNHLSKGYIYAVYEEKDLALLRKFLGGA